MSAGLDAFRDVYRQAVADVMPFFDDERLALVARHNPGWAPGRFDHRAYLEASERRYVIALRTFIQSGGRLDGLRALDVGGFMGAFGLALARIGVTTVLSERYDLYGGAFDELRGFLAAEGVEVWDIDLVAPDCAPAGERFGLVTVMALLEHLANSPRGLMENVSALLADDGLAVLEVPNLAYWPRRMALLRGHSVHPALRDLYAASDPFTGHHREYTEAELIELIELAGFRLRELITFNYTPHEVQPRGVNRLLDLPRRRFRGARELLLACAAGPASQRRP
jgi:2-polyprenyl-3-methyl-5-hydroxy-6-metoxy-1,4-benzoquinol methylase